MEHPYVHILLLPIKQIREGSLSSDFAYKGGWINALFITNFWDFRCWWTSITDNKRQSDW